MHLTIPFQAISPKCEPIERLRFSRMFQESNYSVLQSRHFALDVQFFSPQVEDDHVILDQDYYLLIDKIYEEYI